MPTVRSMRRRTSYTLCLHCRIVIQVIPAEMPISENRVIWFGVGLSPKCTVVGIRIDTSTGTVGYIIDANSVQMVQTEDLHMYVPRMHAFYITRKKPFAHSETKSTCISTFWIIVKFPLRQSGTWIWGDHFLYSTAKCWEYVRTYSATRFWFMPERRAPPSLLSSLSRKATRKKLPYTVRVISPLSCKSVRKEGCERRRQNIIFLQLLLLFYFIIS